MSSVDPVCGSSYKAKPSDAPQRLLEPIARALGTGHPSATIDRLFVSEHVKDLRLIIAFVTVAVMLVFSFEILGTLACLFGIYFGDWRPDFLFSALHGFVTFDGPMLVVFGGVLAWAYQAGSARLGVVDLFACEIDTLCRVALVVDSVSRSIEAFRHGAPRQNGKDDSASDTRHFTSQENYFPVFESNVRDLQTLEACVVINITAFYTYMKAVRDSTRAFVEMSASPARAELQPDPASTLTPAQEAARNVIYMMFLGLESARKAIKHLVEFKPEQTERTIVILISELEAYRFLREQFTTEGDIRYQRLKLREACYPKLAKCLSNEVNKGRASNFSEWEPAWLLLDELNRRCGAVTSEVSQPRRLASTV